MKLLKYLKGFKIAILSLVLVLGVRVVAELALPTYTSNIVDTGIQQSGIEDAVPSKISEKSLNTLELFMSDDEIKQVTENYTKDGNTYILNNVSDETRMKLNNIFKETMTVVLGAKSNNTDLNQVAQGVQAGVVSKDTLTDQRKKAISELGNSADMMTKQGGISFVKEEYKQVGIDTNEIRINYLKEVGLMMIFMTFISGLGSIISNFISSRISAKVAFNLREKLYNKVWQAGTVLLTTVRSVGVMGDERTYEHPVALRAVTSTDAMTADWAHLPYEFLAKVSNEIINKVRGVNRVCYDISSKPPATIEWE